jgi:hypothetical protein
MRLPASQRMQPTWHISFAGCLCALSQGLFLFSKPKSQTDMIPIFCYKICPSSACTNLKGYRISGGTLCLGARVKIITGGPHYTIEVLWSRIAMGHGALNSPVKYATEPVRGRKYKIVSMNFRCILYRRQIQYLLHLQFIPALITPSR